MMRDSTPTLRHHSWRKLIGAFSDAHPKMRSVPSRFLEFALAPAASIAWWLASQDVQSLLTRKKIVILVPGVGPIECVDSGRWLSFIPWLAGQPDLEIETILVGDELVSDEGPISSATWSDKELKRYFKSDFASAVSDRKASTIYNGRLSDWREHGDNTTEPDACILFSPGFGMYFEAWMDDNELIPILRSGIPVGVFSYSHLDAEEDRGFLRHMGIDIVRRDLTVNPWCLGHEMKDAIGVFAQHYWPLRTTNGKYVPESDLEKLRELRDLFHVAEDDFVEFGQVQALARLGARRPVVHADTGKDDAIIVLPREIGILESSRLVGQFDEKGFAPFTPNMLAPATMMASRPADADIFDRIVWSLRMYRDELKLDSPSDDEADDEADDDMPESFEEIMGDFISRAIGRDIGDPRAFMDQMRAAGGIHGPTHPSWADLLTTLGWKIKDYEDEPEQLQPAFYTKSKKHRVTVPVICEAYAFLPDDDDDRLARNAMRVIRRDHPDGALLLFKSMPFREVGGHHYNFGGMLFWGGRWMPFALNETCKSIDHVIDQVTTGFEFTHPDPKYADDHHSLAAPFNLMCYDCDPNEPVPMLGLRTATGWVTLIPSDSAL